MENEIMNYDEVMENEIFETENKDTGIGTGMAMLIGAGLTFAATAAVKLGTKMYTKFKAKKESQEDEEDYEDVTDEDIMNDIK